MQNLVTLKYYNTYSFLFVNFCNAVFFFHMFEFSIIHNFIFKFFHFSLSILNMLTKHKNFLFGYKLQLAFLFFFFKLKKRLVTSSKGIQLLRVSNCFIYHKKFNHFTISKSPMAYKKQSKEQFFFLSRVNLVKLSCLLLCNIFIILYSIGNLLLILTK